MQPFTFEQLPQIVGQLLQKIERIESLLNASTTLPKIEADTLLNIQEAADFLRLSVPTLYGKVSARLIPFSKPGKRLYFSKAELTEWIKQGRKKTRAEITQEAQKPLTSKPK